MAVGQGNSPLANLIEQWNGTAWTIATGPTSTMGTGLVGVSCVGPSSCVAVGVFLPAVGSLTQAVAWNGATWVAQTTPNPPVTPVATDQAALNGVSCVGGQSCWAVGSAVPDSTLTGHNTLVESAPIMRPGYRFVASDGGVFDFGGAVFFGSTGGMTPQQADRGHGRQPRRRRLLAGGLRRRHLHLR